MIMRGLQISKATPNEIIIVAQKSVGCQRVTTSTTGSTAVKNVRTVRCAP